LQYYIGCSGWSYSSWQGLFYPKGIENSKWLRYYSKVFNYVEIDSSFYRIPNEFMVKNWYNRTPENFRFTAKFPKVITHDNFDEDQLSYFFDSISELKEKLLALLIQLPPSIDIVEGLDALKNILPYLDKGFRYAVEVRHRSWFQDLAYNFFANNNMCLVWSQLADIKTPPIVGVVVIRYKSVMICMLEYLDPSPKDNPSSRLCPGYIQYNNRHKVRGLEY
jgi:uncharacterized protein YecE (DUF72 family)